MGITVLHSVHFDTTITTHRMCHTPGNNARSAHLLVHAGWAQLLLPQDSPTFGLYSALRACKAISLRSSLQPRSTVATTFCSWGTMPLGCTRKSTSAASTGTMALLVLGPAPSPAAAGVGLLIPPKTAKQETTAAAGGGAEDVLRLRGRRRLPAGQGYTPTAGCIHTHEIGDLLSSSQKRLAVAPRRLCTKETTSINSSSSRTTVWCWLFWNRATTLPTCGAGES